jgi:predicted anti-sigma-YlaC factor YlaD
MKCNEAEKRVLLQGSGELAAKKGGALAAHLHDCEPCRRFRHALLESRNAFQALEEPSASVLNNIKREARKLAPESKRAKIIYWKPALAMAASFMIALGFFFSASRPDTVGLELFMTETDLLNISDQAVSVMYSGLSEDDLAFNFIMTYREES